MWVLDHPMGLVVVYDTGNNVAISDGNCKSHWSQGSCDFLKPSQTRDDVIDRYLERLGYSVDQVKVVVSSHSHLDHIANIEMFPNAIHVLQKKEIYQAWWPEKFQRSSGAHIMADYDDARDFNYMMLEGDYDLFGDGSVMVYQHAGPHAWPSVHEGEAAEHRYRDPYAGRDWMEENLEGHPAGLNYSVLDYFKSVDRLTMMRDLENAPLWFGHSIKQYESMGEKWYE